MYLSLRNQASLSWQYHRCVRLTYMPNQGRLFYVRGISDTSTSSLWVIIGRYASVFIVVHLEVFERDVGESKKDEE